MDAQEEARRTGPSAALFGSLVTAVMLHERIETTESKASVKPFVDRMVNLANEGSGSPQAGSRFPEEAEAVRRLFADVAPLC